MGIKIWWSGIQIKKLEEHLKSELLVNQDVGETEKMNCPKMKYLYTTICTGLVVVEI